MSDNRSLGSIEKQWVLDACAEYIERELAGRVAKLEKEILLVRCQRHGHPFEKGCTFFTGELPKHDASMEASVGKLFDHKNVPCKLSKNTHKRLLLKGEKVDGGTVDSDLRTEGVPVNDFYWLEV